MQVVGKSLLLLEDFRGLCTRPSQIVTPKKGKQSMQTDEELFDRRRFLQWGVSGAAAVGAQLLLPAASGQQQSPIAPVGSSMPPARPLVLRSADLEVILDPER